MPTPPKPYKVLKSEKKSHRTKAELSLREKGENDIIIVGLQTDFCIDATIKCGFEHGFHILFSSLQD